MIFLVFFDFLKGNKLKNEADKRSYKQKIIKLNEMLYENMYVNDYKTEQLFNELYKLTETDVVERHFVYNKMIDYYYGLRDKQPNAIEKCIKYCKEDIEIAPKVIKEMSKMNTFKHYDENGKLTFTPPEFPSFKRLSIIYENQGKYDRAIEICELALKYNLRDGTKSGFEGRKERLLKKKIKAMK